MPTITLELIIGRLFSTGSNDGWKFRVWINYIVESLYLLMAHFDKANKIAKKKIYK